MAKLSEQDRQDIIDDLTANCDCWKHNGDREVLNDFTDEKLVSLKRDHDKNQQAIAVANAAVRGFRDGSTNDGYKLNPESMQWEKIPATTTNAKKKPMMDEEDMGDSGADEEEEGEPPLRKKPTKNSAVHRRQSLPADVQAKLDKLDTLMNEKKSAIANQILANSAVPESDKRSYFDHLMTKDPDDLQLMYNMMPKRPALEEEPKKPTRNQRRPARQVVDEDTLVLPTMNFSDPKNPVAEASGALESVENDDEDMAEDEWLRNAPQRVRNKWNKLQGLEEQERRGLIDQILANVEEDEEDTLLASLQRKSLDDLRIMARVAAPREQKQKDYFGSAGYSPPTGNARIGGEDQTDLLPIPTVNWEEVSKETLGKKGAG